MSWYPEGFELYVDNPRYGELVVRATADQERWEATFDGAELGTFLHRVTERALGLDPAPPLPGDRPLPAALTAEAARTILPALQRAVVLAAAGTDAFERTFPDPDAGPCEPYCVDCGEGSGFSGATTISARCLEYGHHAYGMGTTTTWESAQQRYQLARQRWDEHRGRRTGPRA